MGLLCTEIAVSKASILIHNNSNKKTFPNGFSTLEITRWILLTENMTIKLSSLFSDHVLLYKNLCTKLITCLKIMEQTLM